MDERPDDLFAAHPGTCLFAPGTPPANLALRQLLLKPPGPNPQQTAEYSSQVAPTSSLDPRAADTNGASLPGMTKGPYTSNHLPGRRHPCGLTGAAFLCAGARNLLCYRRLETRATRAQGALCGGAMRFHHMAVMVSDLQAAIRLWRDVMGFELAVETVIPDGPEPGPNYYMYPKLLDDIFKVKNARSKMALLSSKEGALIELQECENPKIAKTPAENLRYAHTGFHELGLVVEDIDSWFKKVRAAGYQTQTEYVWQCASIGRSFLFYDEDGNMIQLWEPQGKVAWKTSGDTAKQATV